MSGYLVQLLLPLRDNEGQPFGRAAFGQVRDELIQRFGGVTAHLQAPAEGAWREGGGEVERDQVVVFEVMTEQLERQWWSDYREELRRRFRQEELVVRAVAMERL